MTEYAYVQIQDGLAVAVHPAVVEAEQDTYFGTSLLSDGILPVLVTVENRTATSSFILLTDRVFFVKAGVSAESGAADAHVGRPTAAHAWAFTGAALGAVVPLLVGAAMVSKSNAVRHNFLSKEFRSDTVSPGQTARGFLYFQIPEEEDTAGSWKMHLEVFEPVLRQVKNFDFSVDWRGGR